ncbi:MAG: monomethylamine:corrinoid methyltransferase, partial [Oscillospiraceae bacterium]
FEECYDLTTLQPTDEYISVYDEAAEVLAKLGLELGK